MNKEQRDKHTYELMIKNNPDEAVKNLLLRDKKISRLNNRIDNAIEYIENNQEEHKFTDRGGFTYTDGHFLRDVDDLLNILKGNEEK